MYHELPLIGFLEHMLNICREGRSGTLFFITEDESWGKFVINDGNIVQFGYKMKWGDEALPIIRNIKRTKFHFQPSEKQRSADDERADSSITKTREVFNYFGLRFHSAPASSAGASAVVGRGDRQDQVPFPIPRKKILIADDSDFMRKILTKSLSEAGYEVVEARDGFEALGQLSNELPDLLVLDLIMPGIDGYKVLEQVKKSERFQQVPVIILTSRDSLLDKLKGKMSSSDEYLTKPFKPHMLLEKVQKYLD